MRLMQMEYAELRDRVYPLLMDPVQIHEKGQGDMVNGAIAEGLVVTYCLEESEEKIRYITYQDLRDWGISHTTLHITAMKNLEKRTEGERINRLSTPDGGRPMYIWHLEDGFDGTRALLEDWIEELADAVEGDLLIGVPHRNFMVAIGSEDDELVKLVRRKVMAEHHSAGFPVSPFLYRWTGQGYERYKG